MGPFDIIGAAAANVPFTLATFDVWFYSMQQPTLGWQYQGRMSRTDLQANLQSKEPALFNAVGNGGVYYLQVVDPPHPLNLGVSP